MSADNRAVCPESYGLVPVEEFDRMRTELQLDVAKPPEHTFREDYEFWRAAPQADRGAEAPSLVGAERAVDRHHQQKGHLMDRRPGWDTYFLDIAETVASRSTCSRLGVGAVLTYQNRIMATGYNGAPAGAPHCQHRGDEPCDISVHAEVNAFASLEEAAARYGRLAATASGYTLHVTHMPCRVCAQHIVARGVVRVVYRKAYRSTEGLDYLREHGILADHVISYGLIEG